MPIAYLSVATESVAKSKCAVLPVPTRVRCTNSAWSMTIVNQIAVDSDLRTFIVETQAIAAGLESGSPSL